MKFPSVRSWKCIFLHFSKLYNGFCAHPPHPKPIQYKSGHLYSKTEYWGEVGEWPLLMDAKHKLVRSTTEVRWRSIFVTLADMWAMTNNAKLWKHCIWPFNWERCIGRVIILLDRFKYLCHRTHCDNVLRLSVLLHWLYNLLHLGIWCLILKD